MYDQAVLVVALVVVDRASLHKQNAYLQCAPSQTRWWCLVSHRTTAPAANAMVTLRARRLRAWCALPIDTHFNMGRWPAAAGPIAGCCLFTKVISHAGRGGMYECFLMCVVVTTGHTGNNRDPRVTASRCGKIDRCEKSACLEKFGNVRSSLQGQNQARRKKTR